MFVTALHRRRLHKIIRDGLAGWWPTDEGSGSTLNDIIGGNDLTVSGGTWGEVGGKDILSFNGTDEYAYSASLFALPQSEGTFIISWRPNETLSGDHHCILRARDYTPLRVMDLFPSTTGTGYFGWYDDGDEDRVSLSPPWSSGTWYTLALTWKSGETTKLYTDAVLEATSATTLTAEWDTSAGDTIYLGRAEVHYAAMSMRDMRTYSRRLSTAEMLAIMAGLG